MCDDCDQQHSSCTDKKLKIKYLKLNVWITNNGFDCCMKACAVHIPTNA